MPAAIHYPARVDREHADYEPYQAQENSAMSGPKNHAPHLG